MYGLYVPCEESEKDEILKDEAKLLFNRDFLIFGRKGLFRQSKWGEPVQYKLNITD